MIAHQKEIFKGMFDTIINFTPSKLLLLYAYQWRI